MALRAIPLVDERTSVKPPMLNFSNFLDIIILSPLFRVRDKLLIAVVIKRLYRTFNHYKIIIFCIINIDFQVIGVNIIIFVYCFCN